MDHGGMDHGGHGGMDHGGGHGGMDHGGMDMGGCSMSMTWNWDTTNLCILTSSWRITTPLSLYISLTFIAFCGVLYEWLRLYIRRLDSRLARGSPSGPLSNTHRRRASLLLPTSNPSNAASSSNGISISADRRGASKRRSISSTITTAVTLGEERKWVKPLETTRKVQIWRSTLYATSVGISFLLMLVGMTFNGWVILAIVVGAGMGHYWFNRDLSSNSSGAGLGSVDDKGLACHM